MIYVPSALARSLHSLELALRAHCHDEGNLNSSTDCLRCRDTSYRGLAASHERDDAAPPDEGYRNPSRAGYWQMPSRRASVSRLRWPRQGPRPYSDRSRSLRMSRPRRRAPPATCPRYASAASVSLTWQRYASRAQSCARLSRGPVQRGISSVIGLPRIPLLR